MPQLRHVVGVIGLTIAGSLVGCVPAEQYAGMKMKADQLAAQVASDQTSINTANAERDAAQRQLQQYNNASGTQTALLTNLTEQNQELQKQNADAAAKYARAVELNSHIGSTPALPTTLNNELTDFAAKNSNLIDFDAARGIVKFKSDVTFAAGDATVTAQAKSVLSSFASILSSPGADTYELLVAGHTDNTPVTNKLTIQKGNFDNWYLSAHRAIAVSHELITDGVLAKRLGVVGYAEERPIPGGTNAANRRVEVLILPTTSHGSGSYTKAAVSKTHRTKTAPVDAVTAGATLNKDGGGSATPPPAPVIMNK